MLNKNLTSVVTTIFTLFRTVVKNNGFIKIKYKTYFYDNWDHCLFDLTTYFIPFISLSSFQEGSPNFISRSVFIHILRMNIISRNSLL